MATDGPRPVPANTKKKFTEGVHLPVRKHDRIALTGNQTDCLRNAPTEEFQLARLLPSNPKPGEKSRFTDPEEGVVELLAWVEPDVDADGYGDETQDACLGSPRHALPCTDPPPGNQSGSADTTAPRLTLTGKGVQDALKAKAVTTIVAVNETSQLDATGSVSIKGGASFSLVEAKAPATPAAKTILSLAIPKSGLKKIKAALKAGKKVSAGIRVTAPTPPRTTATSHRASSSTRPSRAKKRTEGRCGRIRGGANERR